MLTVARLLVALRALGLIPADFSCRREADHLKRVPLDADLFPGLQEEPVPAAEANLREGGRYQRSHKWDLSRIRLFRLARASKHPRTALRTDPLSPIKLLLVRWLPVTTTCESPTPGTQRDATGQASPRSWAGSWRAHFGAPRQDRELVVRAVVARVAPAPELRGVEEESQSS